MVATLNRLRYPLIFAFFAFHFTVAGLGMAKANARIWPRQLAPVIAIYTRVTGACAGFGFFSPAIPKEVEVQFDIDTPDRGMIHTSLQKETDPEVSFRLGNM